LVTSLSFVQINVLPSYKFQTEETEYYISRQLEECPFILLIAWVECHKEWSYDGRVKVERLNAHITITFPQENTWSVTT